METASIFRKKAENNSVTTIDGAITISIPISNDIYTGAPAFAENNKTMDRETPPQQMSIPVIFINGNGKDLDMESIVNALSASFNLPGSDMLSFDPSFKKTGKDAGKHILRLDDLELNMETYTAKRGGTTLNLQLRQFKLLQYMMQNKERLLSETELINNVWEDSLGGLKSKVLSACISKLRTLVDKNAGKKLIHTRYSLGYIFSDNL